MKKFDIAFIGHFTKDTIVTAEGTKVMPGGAYYFGANAAARTGRRTAAVTRLAREDFAALESLRSLGVEVRAIESPESTCLRLEYPSTNPDERVLTVTSAAEPFVPADVEGIEASVWSVGASIRGEVGLDVLEALKAAGARIGLDVQGFVRVLSGGTLVHDDWPGKEAVLKLTDVLKADIVEAGILTGRVLEGTEDLKAAAESIAGFGPRELVLTHRDGVVVFAEGRFHEAPFLPKKVLGRSGRGDTCLAAYLSRRITHDFAAATLWAAALTTLKLETAGPFSGTAADVERTLRERYA